MAEPSLKNSGFDINLKLGYFSESILFVFGGTVDFIIIVLLVTAEEADEGVESFAMFSITASTAVRSISPFLLFGVPTAIKMASDCSRTVSNCQKNWIFDFLR